MILHPRAWPAAVVTVALSGVKDLPKPESRIQSDIAMPDSPAQPTAAVAVIRTVPPDSQYLFIKRSNDPADPWSGHYAFPGGGKEPADPDLLQTSIRETGEEVGITLRRDMLVAELPAKMAGNYLGYPVCVQPFVFEVPKRLPTVMDSAEVVHCEWRSKSYLRDSLNHCSLALSPRLPEVAFACIKVEQGYIWGFTYEVLQLVI
ncbi:MAG: NUDIX domain-containing protein [Chitinivibrionales bacterium]|nr:NUDIX domain-containing protein [Chitinivibrionales bacterium]